VLGHLADQAMLGTAQLVITALIDVVAELVPGFYL